MRHAVRSCIFTLCLAGLSAGPAFTQTSSSEASSAATVSGANVAYVYVGTAKGVYLYDAASNGKLTLVSGSPFKIAGTAAGSSGKYFLTLGTQYLHSYPVAANGALKAQVSQINTADHADGACGPTSSATLDHSGQNVYVLLVNLVYPTGCSAYQTFDISHTNGALTFAGAVMWSGYAETFPITFTANDQFAYALNSIGDGNPGDMFYWQFLRQSNGTLQTGNINTYGNDSNFPWVLTAGPSNYVAASMGTILNYGSPIVSTGPTYLVSYTVDSAGNLNTTNSQDQMPIPAVGPTVMNLSPSGTLLAVGGNLGCCSQEVALLGTNGLQVFHFNGADPITPYSGTLTTAPIDELHWDNSNHLYALSNSTNKLYVYTITPTSITAAPGSPYTINSSANALVVVPTTAGCTAPASDGVNICSPVSGSSVSSPVLVEAAATVTGTIVSTQLWVDGVKNFNAPGSDTLNTSVSLAAGTHRFAVIATNTSGQKWESTVTATVK
jgi:hypothetical protein